MVVARRLWAISAIVFISACAESGDRTRLAVTLGAAADALTLEGVDIRRFELRVTCVDGSETVQRGLVTDGGGFTAEVPTCPQATVRFRGLTADDLPALDGAVDVAIRAPDIPVAIPVRRVGTIEFVNDDTYASACKAFVPNAPQYDIVFTLEPGASRQEVLPVNGTQLSCAPADVCPAASCDFAGPLATVRSVAVPFGNRSTLSLANLSNRLIFSVLPPLVATAGVAIGAFEATLVDERDAPIPRNDVQASLTTFSPTTHGGFANATVTMINGAAQFTAVTFTTAGPLTFRATAVVDGVVLSTDDRTIEVGAGALGQLILTGPQRVPVAVTADYNIAAADTFGNLTALPDDITLSSNDQQSDPVRYRNLIEPVVQFTFFTAGTRTLTARYTAEPSIEGTLQVEVEAGAAASLVLVGPQGSVFVGQVSNWVVTARDAWGNIASGYVGTVELLGMPATGFTYGQPYTFTAGDAGVHVFNSVSFGTTGQIMVEASDLGNDLSSNAVFVNVVDAGAIQDIVIVNSVPNPLVANEQFELQVILTDITGQVINPSGANLQVTRSDGVAFSAPTFTANGSIAVFSGLSIATAANNVQLVVESVPAAAGGPEYSNTFNIIPAGACNEAHVDKSLPVDTCVFHSIQAAIEAVDSGGRILVKGDNYDESLTIADKRVTIEGGYTGGVDWVTRNWLTNTSRVTTASATDYMVRVAGTADATFDGVDVSAASALGSGTERWDFRVTGGARLTVRNSRLQGPETDLPLIGGIAYISDAAHVVFANNWMQIGYTTQVPGVAELHAIYNVAGAAKIDIVHNTILLHDTARADALQFGGTGSAITFTNNLVVGDFSTCDADTGVCVAKGLATADAQTFASAQGNHILSTGEEGGATYVDRERNEYASLNDVGGQSFAFNATTYNEAPQSIFVGFDGTDGVPATVNDNDWHLQQTFERRTGFDATQAACGSAQPPKQACSGLPRDIDDVTRPTDPSPGADELGPTGSM